MEEKLLLDIALPDHKEVREAFDSVMVKLYAQYQKNKEEEKRNVQQGTEIEVQKGFVFLVCGTDPFVGTSTTVLYLAAGLAKSGKHVLLVDADLRKDRMEKQIGREYIGRILAGNLYIRKYYISNYFRRFRCCTGRKDSRSGAILML